MVKESRTNVLKLSTSTGRTFSAKNSATLSEPLDYVVFKEMADNALEGILVHQMHKPLYVNRAWAELHGCTVSEVMNVPTVGNFWHESECDRMSGYARDRMAGRRPPSRYRYLARQKGGGLFWAEQFVRVVNWSGERAIQSTIFDVDDQEKQADQMRLFASVIEQVSDRISVIGTDYRYRLTNKANLDFYQKPLEAFIGHHIADILGEQAFFEYSKDELDRCFAGETVSSQRNSLDADGSLRRLDILIEPYREPNDVISGAVITIRDVTEAYHLSKKLAYQARHDQLTGLINRQTFEEYLEHAIKDTADTSRSAAFCFIDLDQFKIVNDTVGHLVGDQLLKQVAKLLKQKVREGDVLARLGGDEFGLLLKGCSLRRAERAAEKLVAVLNENRFFHEGHVFEVGASIGITAINRYTHDISEVMSRADLACYAAKDHGRNRVHIFKKQDTFLCRRREEMQQAGGIRAALDQDQFTLYAQPIEEAADNRGGLDRIEILLRMTGDADELIMPACFIPAAERYGFMGEIDRWVIRKTVGYLAGNLTNSLDLRININISGTTLNDDSLLDFVREVFSETEISARQICFEITETAAINNLVKSEAFIRELRDSGCEFALDDFGSGVSSLNYLKRLSVDYLKIDRTFIKDVRRDGSSRTMVAAIHQMAKALGIETVAEGVEDRPTRNVLKDLGVDFVQGFEVGAPKPLAFFSRQL